MFSWHCSKVRFFNYLVDSWIYLILVATGLLISNRCLVCSVNIVVKWDFNDLVDSWVSHFNCHRFIRKQQVFSVFSRHYSEVSLSGALVDCISHFNCHRYRYTRKQQVFSGSSQQCSEVRLSGDLVDCISHFNCHRYTRKQQVFSGSSQPCSEVRLSGDLVDSISVYL